MSCVHVSFGVQREPHVDFLDISFGQQKISAINRSYTLSSSAHSTLISSAELKLRSRLRSPGNPVPSSALAVLSSAPGAQHGACRTKVATRGDWGGLIPQRCSRRRQWVSSVGFVSTLQFDETQWGAQLGPSGSLLSDLGRGVGGKSWTRVGHRWGPISY